MIVNQNVNNDGTMGMVKTIPSNCSAELLVYTPKVIPNQQVRCYNYNFDQNTIGTIQEAAMDYSNGGMPTPQQQQILNSAITMDSNGVALNVSALSESWTFVLILNKQSNNYQQMSHSSLHILSGYFINSEPINMSTMQMQPTINPRAVMVFTHSMNAFQTNTLGPKGMSNKLNINGVGDHIGMGITQYMPTDMFLGGMQDMCNAHAMNTSHSYPLGSMMVSNLNDNSTMIPDIMKSPKHHMNNILTAVAASSDDDYVYSDITYDMLSTPDKTFSENLPSNMVIPNIGELDVSVPITIHMLDEHLNGNLYIQPVTIAKVSPWAIKPQNIVRHDVIMSSMITHTISAIANGLGIGTIAFRYNSYGNTMSDKGVWELSTAAPPSVITQVTQQQLTSILNQFKLQLERNLFPLLKNNGEFEMMIHFDAIGETLVDFHYLDMATDYGFTETPNRLASMTNPNLMPVDNVVHNIEALGELKNNIVLNTGGMNEFSSSSYGY